MTEISLELPAEYKIECDITKCKECNRECIHEFCKECKYQKKESLRQTITSLSTFGAGSLFTLIFTSSPIILLSGGLVASVVCCKIMDYFY